jgi:7-cyano-7-deazaguanine synthase
MSPPSAPNAVVLLSGGLDSATVLAIAKKEGFACHALSVDYGQRHFAELAAAAVVAQALGAAAHRTVRIDLGQFGGSALTDRAIAVPVGGVKPGIPVTYVPARNTIMLSLAMAWAETLSARDIFIGVNAVDYSGYPDCRPEFIRAFEAMANLATRAAIEGAKTAIHTPIIDLAKPDIVRLGVSLGVDYAMTVSC